jgi:hypothetical protein
MSQVISIRLTVLLGLVFVLSPLGLSAQSLDRLSAPATCLVTDENPCDDGNDCTLDSCERQIIPVDNPEFNRFQGLCRNIPIEHCVVTPPPPPLPEEGPTEEPIEEPVAEPADEPTEPVPPPAPAPEDPEPPVEEAPAPVAEPRSDPERRVCGNGIVEAGEECDSGPACDLECRFNIEAFPDCRITEDELRAMEPSQIISKYGFGEFEQCALAGGGAGKGLEKAALDAGDAGGGCSLIRGDRKR